MKDLLNLTSDGFSIVGYSDMKWINECAELQLFCFEKATNVREKENEKVAIHKCRCRYLAFCLMKYL